MPLSDDWQINYVPVTVGGVKEIIHIDGILSYGSNTGTAPALNDYVYQAATGAIGRVIAGSDLGGVSATGTLTLTNVRGRFDGTTALTVLTALNFDTVANGGFKIGDTITGPTTESLDVLAIEYNEGPKVVKDAGEGWAYGNNLTTGFANNEQIDVTGGASAVALVHTGAEDTAATFTGAVATATLTVPGTAETNYSLIIHYDAGTIDIPEGAQVSDQTTGAQGLVEQVLGVTATGSLRLVDTSLTPAWTDNNNIDGEEVVFFNAQVAGQVFIENGLYEGQTSGARFSILPAGIIDDGDSTGKLWTNGVSAALTLNEDIHQILPGDILGNKIAQVEQVSTTLPTVAVVNVPDGIRTEQVADAGVSQGGIYAAGVSLNIRRDSNRFLSYIKGVFAETAQLNDKSAINGNVRDSLYTILRSNDWEMPDLSFRFIEKGAWQDDGLNNRWTNYQAGDDIFTGADITAEGFARTATKPRPMPDAYCEQGGAKLDSFWLEGPFSAIIKVKSTTDMGSIDPATPAVGQLIDGGNVVWHSRPYGRFYSFFDNAQVGTLAGPVLDNKDDAQNNTGQYRAAFTLGGAGAYTVGEEIRTADGTKRGIVTASDSGAAGNVDYNLLTDVQFVNTDVVVGEVSAKSTTFAAPSSLVAGYGTNIRTMVVDILAASTPAAVVTGTFIVGEPVTQAVTGATGFLLHATADELYLQVNTGTFSGDNNITGDTSLASWNPGVTTQTYNAQTTVPKDLDDGSGALNYAGVSSANITGASAQAVADLYEWDKFLTNEKATDLQGGRGTIAGVQGKFYRGFDPTFAEIKTAPYGAKPGAIMQGAEGHFIDKDTLALADLQNLRVTPIGGTELTPPNLQAAQISNLQAGWNGGIYRSTGAESLDIQTTEFQVGAGNAAGNSTIVLQAGDRTVSPLASDVPSTGVVEAIDPNNPGIFLSFPYSSINRATNTVTLTSGTIGDVTGGAALVQGDDLFVAWAEETAAGAIISNTVQYIGDVNLVAIARKKGFDDYTSAQVFTATGVNFAVNRTADGVVVLP